MNEAQHEALVEAIQNGEEREHVDQLLHQEREDERARLVWWLRSCAVGPGSVTTTRAYVEAVTDLADVIEQHPERFADAPTGRRS